jgi:signal transduction histidine kinase/CheY-like chemotaxis protein
MLKDIFTRIQNRVLGASRTKDHNLQYWREQIFSAIVLTFLFFGFIAYIVGIIACLESDLFFVAAIDTIVYFSMIFIFFNKKVPFKIKVNSILVVLYLLGTILLINLGKEGEGFCWLFTFPIMAGILEGLRASIYALIINLVTYFILGVVFIHYQLLPTSPLIEYSLTAWVSVSINTIFLNAVAAVSLGVILRGLKTSVSKQKKLASELQNERQALKKSNKKLKKEINHKNQLQEELYQSQKLKSIGTLAGGVAHDFNNILTVIIGLTQMLINQTDESDPDYKHLNNIYESGNRAARLTRQLLLFSRKQEMELKVLNLNKTISRLNKMLNRLIGEDIKMHQDLADDISLIKADEGQLEQVITNLVVNARDAMPNGGQLTITTREISINRHKAQTISEISPGKYILLTIEDSGKGIDEKIQDQVFDPFFTTKSRGEGTGMGLSVVHGIIKKHEGVINFTSKPGQGTVFRIYLPVIQGKGEKQVKQKKKESFEKYMGQGEHILIVEDEKHVLAYLENIMDNYQYNFYSARSAEQALEIFQDKKEVIDLIISDVIMTGMDGVALADKLQELKPDLKIILSSGYSAKKVAPGEIKEKGYKFIQKPYEVKHLLELIRAMLEG